VLTRGTLFVLAEFPLTISFNEMFSAYLQAYDRRRFQVKHRAGYDDALDAFGVHGMGGLVGGILTGMSCQFDAQCHAVFYGGSKSYLDTYTSTIRD
jgi:hypothetical protein